MFKFRLSTILRFKEYNEKLCQEELGRCVQKLRLARLKEKEIQFLIEQLEKNLSEMQVGILNIEKIVNIKEYLLYQRELLVLQKKTVEARMAELKAAQEKLVEAMKERKVLEKLKTKQYERYLYEEDRKEQAFLDDLANK